MKLRPRPYVPVIYGTYGKSPNEQALQILALFFPWVIDPEDASHAVPFVQDIFTMGMRDWQEALRSRIFQFGIPTEEVKRFAVNFCFVFCLPRDLRGLTNNLEENSDNEGLEDELLALDENDMLEATLTHVKGKRAKPEEAGAPEDDDTAIDAEDEEGAGTGTPLYEMTKQMLYLSSAIWLKGALEEEGHDPAARAHYEMMLQAGAVQDHDQVKQAARASASKAKQEAPLSSEHSRLVGAPRMAEGPTISTSLLMNWLHSGQVRGALNDKQFEMLELIVDRILVENKLQTPQVAKRQTEEPLRYLLHGPPGTGKSHVLSFIRQLFDLVGYKQGIDYAVVAFQAVNAADLKGGQTIHHAFGINMQKDLPVKPETAKRLALWRWLFIDEIGMVNARLFGQMDQRLVAFKPATDLWRVDGSGNIRPFAGLNIIAAGDFQQLPPPEGGFLASLPRRLLPANLAADGQDPLVEHGKELMWEGMEGVVELTERQRCKDEWWNEVCDELRSGQLSEQNWKYLHGTPVPGCQLSKEELASRKRLIHGPDDPRLQEDRFKEAVAIVANNDARYHINKDRARRYCKAAGVDLRWAVAKDVASTPVLQSQMCNKDTKIKRLGERIQAVFLKASF